MLPQSGQRCTSTAQWPNTALQATIALQANMAQQANTGYQANKAQQASIAQQANRDEWETVYTSAQQALSKVHTKLSLTGQ